VVAETYLWLGPAPPPERDYPPLSRSIEASSLSDLNQTVVFARGYDRKSFEGGLKAWTKALGCPPNVGYG
jgi:hypothetical protein